MPPPPHGEASWLDAACRGMVSYGGNKITDYARAELAALRKALEQARARADLMEPAYVNAVESLDVTRSVAKSELEKLAKELADTRADGQKFYDALHEAWLYLDLCPCPEHTKCGTCEYHWQVVVAVVSKALGEQCRFKPEGIPHDATMARLVRELADTKGQLALQSANTVEAMQQRDEAKQEVVELRAQVERTVKERDELRAAVLGLGQIQATGPLAECLEDRVCNADIERFNALVAKLRGEAGQEGRR